jgi:ectoine hydroxylase-related dioxygenase (phytanoyl-CoA dioxygenase family)
MQGFATAIGTPDLTAAFDRMSINLPTSSKNPVTMERAAQSFEHGKFGVMQQMHTHKNGYYDKLNEAQTGEPEYTDYYGIVPLWDMNKATGATAVVPGSHKLVPEINAFRKTRRDDDGKYIGPAASEAADIECFTANGLTPCVSCIRAGDLVIFGECQIS